MKYEVGKIIKGTVTGVEKYGVFVGFDEFYSGLIHISEISEDFVRNVFDYVSIGETIKTKILQVDSDNCRLKLSIKGIDYRESIRKKYKINETKDGFQSLKRELSKWVDMKEMEYSIKK